MRARFTTRAAFSLSYVYIRPFSAFIPHIIFHLNPTPGRKCIFNADFDQGKGVFGKIFQKIFNFSYISADSAQSFAQFLHFSCQKSTLWGAGVAALQGLRTQK